NSLPSRYCCALPRLHHQTAKTPLVSTEASIHLLTFHLRLTTGQLLSVLEGAPKLQQDTPRSPPPGSGSPGPGSSLVLLPPINLDPALPAPSVSICSTTSLESLHHPPAARSPSRRRALCFFNSAIPPGH